MNKLPTAHRTMLNYAKTLNAVFAIRLFFLCKCFLGVRSSQCRHSGLQSLQKVAFFFLLVNARRGKSEGPTFLKS